VISSYCSYIQGNPGLVNFLKGIFVLSSQSLSINVLLFRTDLQGGSGNTVMSGVSTKNEGITVSVLGLIQ